MIQLQNFTDFTINVMHEASITGEFEKGFALLEQHRKVLATGLEPEMFLPTTLIFTDMVMKKIKASPDSEKHNAVRYKINKETICIVFSDGSITWYYNTIGELIDKLGSVKVPDNYVELLKL